MWVVVMIFCTALVLFACEKWFGSYPIDCLDQSEQGHCLPNRLSIKEVAFRVMPIFLGGIGLPLTFAYPIAGIACLVLALVLFISGRKLNM
jgi:hypothetical protein